MQREHATDVPALAAPPLRQPHGNGRHPAAGPVRIYHQRPKPGARMRMVSRLAFPLGVCIAVAAAVVHVAGLS